MTWHLYPAHHNIQRVTNKITKHLTLELLDDQRLELMHQIKLEPEPLGTLTDSLVGFISTGMFLSKNYYFLHTELTLRRQGTQE